MLYRSGEAIRVYPLRLGQKGGVIKRTPCAKVLIQPEIDGAEMGRIQGRFLRGFRGLTYSSFVLNCFKERFRVVAYSRMLPQPRARPGFSCFTHMQKD
jgi:hypothetical protein